MFIQYELLINTNAPRETALISCISQTELLVPAEKLRIIPVEMFFTCMSCVDWIAVDDISLARRVQSSLEIAR